MQTEIHAEEQSGTVFEMPEPQAFIADPDSDWNMVPITKSDLDALRSGDKVTWDDLAAKLGTDESDKAAYAKGEKPITKQPGVI